ncbi:hypothetical protein [Bacillus tequilensis]|uniref:hypothetical protein n=1 Tax=Bacillus tequilensis TaxID=227866 RepID=UPI0004658D0B|nr:hypothetical protein [Bacillus tequilensis]MDR4436155.1 hypothetical protein [Bacillus tequilensis]SPT93259.1 Major virion structural protein [Bacillus tequilensis]
MSKINVDGFFDIDLSVQLLPTDLEALFNAGGWSTLGKYRSFAQLTDKNGVKDPYRKTFAETYLFESQGSDNQHRYFGFTTGYGGKVTPFGEEPVISKDTFLGELKDVTPNGATKLNTVFEVKVKPIVPSSVIVYREGGEMVKPTETPYIVDGEKGTITFEESQSGVLRATYALTDNAPDVVKRLWFFTFEGFIPTKLILRSENPNQAELLDEAERVFRFKILPGNQRIRENSYKFYETVDGTDPIDPADYTVNHDEGTVTFNEGTEPLALYADYEIEAIKDSNGSYGDIEVLPFNPSVPTELMGAAYNAVRFIYPSVPTAVSFIPQEEMGLGWGRDSQVYFWGNITKDRIVSYFRLDPAPDPESTYFAPLYIGRLSTIGKTPRLNNVLIGGARSEDEIGYSSGLKIGRNKVDYGVNTSNGNSSVMVQRTVGGAMYQKHYLAFITHDADVDPSNESRFNPSVYSGKYHISPMYIVHPADGYVGRLDEVYAIHPKNIAQLDELEVKETSNSEHVGTGDGFTKEFHLFHKPVIDGDIEIRLVSDTGCTTLTQAEYVEFDPSTPPEEGKFTVDGSNKKLILGAAPIDGIEVIMDYDYEQTYRYTLADTPRTPFLLANMTPYAPIGLGFLKENL